MSLLAEKMRRARESAVTVNGRRFTVRRPSVVEIRKLNAAAQAGDELAWINACVVGWDLKELDCVPGGTDAAVPFDRSDWETWIADQPAYWIPLHEAITAELEKYAASIQESEKN